ncbi:MAG: hypothetical protein IPP22_16770 [Nitrosomonas sp.]|nr:hypothetical protein [Nitrosomonas sp.]
MSYLHIAGYSGEVPGEIIDYDFNQCGLSRLYRVSDQLLRHRDALETHLFMRECTLFDLNCTITLYDLTNTSLKAAANTMIKLFVAVQRRSGATARWLHWVWCLTVAGFRAAAGFCW